MKAFFVVLLLGGLAALPLSGQTDRGKPHNFPLVLTVQFHSLSMPFRNLAANLANVGVGLGTEVRLSGNPKWVQNVTAVWYRNRAAGNGILLYTQTVWRPVLFQNAYGEVRAGAGYAYAFRPVRSYRPTEGRWAPAGRSGKGMLAVPLGLSLGFDAMARDGSVSPFLSYQFVPLLGYNQTIPLMPQTLLQMGARIHVD